ncbi:sugar phosphate isomerase/epimerase [Neolewinella aurantiaca]|uniref:Sugar phosphate isomerase/epimerase n=1 Tax=Neolewinella aurantiaca TaxID=2602767 RepID=A0A5C7FIE1_9BACT|nr:sugar phosphate isomerase/epimerase [Neolewinella aurantiaca]TXF90296.1 sugar phosphate isomerase/epimerase [Neolewinella aurantiaca]
MIKQIFPLFLLFFTLAACNDSKPETAAEAPAAEQELDVTTDFGGLALYTLRDTLAGDPKGVLKKVADLGYKYIEAAGYKEGKFYGMTPTEFKNYLAEVGLTPISSHHSDITIETTDQVVADLKEAGFQYLVIPIPPMGAFTYDAETKTLGMNQSAEMVMKNVNAIAQKCADGGIQCLYHNHDFEFMAGEDGIVPIDYFIENSDPEILNFQMDLYWVTKAGADPVAYFDKAPGRFKAWHVKDMDDQGRFAPVGEGNIDFKRILAAREKSGMEFYLVEQDMCFNHTALEAIAISHKGLREIGFE